MGKKYTFPKDLKTPSSRKGIHGSIISLQEACDRRKTIDVEMVHTFFYDSFGQVLVFLSSLHDERAKLVQNIKGGTETQLIDYIDEAIDMLSETRLSVARLYLAALGVVRSTSPLNELAKNQSKEILAFRRECQKLHHELTKLQAKISAVSDEKVQHWLYPNKGVMVSTRRIIRLYSRITACYMASGLFAAAVGAREPEDSQS